jgi:mono/diheme cytochrome c family protein
MASRRINGTLMRAEKRGNRLLLEVTMVAQSSFYEMTRMNRGLRAWSIILAALVGFLASSLTSLAQDNDKVKAGLEVWKKTGCADCHGAFANGEKERDESPTGANLRTARLDAAELKVVISCGKPGGSGMPAFDEGAYKVRACYGRPLGAPPDNLYPAGVTLSPAEIDAVIVYLQARIIGRGRITKQECLAYYDDRPDECADIN